MFNIVSAFGLSASAGLNAYIPLLVVSLLAKYTDLINLSSPWDAMTSWWVIGVLIFLSIIEVLADKIIERCGSKAGKEFLSYEQAYGRAFDDMKRRVPCLERINEAIGFEPRHSLDQTLQLIIDDVK